MGHVETFQVMLTPQQFERAAAQLRSMNPGKDYLREGTLPETKGVSLSYSVSGMATGMSIVTFTVKKKPMLVPVSAIRAHVRKLIGDDADEEA
ncbi:MAG TPA: hypothetical protein VFW25_02345 [Silvibacterium sp.]|nr:hypothetical protein [Silvibacterium sp.]